MVPIQELLARIRWDPEFGRGEFVLGYLDHVNHDLRHVALRDAQPDPRNPSMLDIVDDQGRVISLPVHRIRQVLRNGEMIWQRSGHAQSGS